MNKVLILICLSVIFFGACNQKTKTQSSTMDSAIAIINDIVNQPEKDSEIYVLSMYKPKDTPYYFVSFSNTFLDTLDLSKAKDIKANENATALEYIEFPEQEKNKLLKGLGFAPTDSLYLLDLGTSEVSALPIAHLKAVGLLSPYVSNENSYEFDDYMVGLEIEPEDLKNQHSGFQDDVFVMVAKENPFVVGGLKKIDWQPIKLSQIPKQLQISDSIQTAEPSFHYSDGANDYYLQSFTRNNEPVKRHLSIWNKNKNELVFQIDYSNSEGISLKPIPNENKDMPEFQYAGQLLKGKPAVVFGFLYYSFGCTVINFIDKSEPELIINCDNRH